jgi:protein-S-isoprenylcysteine O-methyltransferase Ste14
MSGLPALGRRGEGWVVLQVVLLGIVILGGVAAAAGLTPTAWNGSARVALAVIGLMLMVLGVLQLRRGTADLGSNLTPLPKPTEASTLVETGIYGRVRHPIYGGIILGGTGWALLTAAPIALAAAIVLIPFFWAKSSVEERWLVSRYPGYEAYRRRTNRFIAWPG